jgi:hypothetical protein
MFLRNAPHYDASARVMQERSRVSTEHLATYLNDHLAGAMVALELLEHLQKAHAGTPLEKFAGDLYAEIDQDREVLVNLMGKLNIAVSRTRQAAAWLTEKAERVKLRFDDPSGGNLLLYQILEILSLGIEGKSSLWTALEAAAEDAPALRLENYDALRQRAVQQRDRVESRRITTARKTFAPGA